jgi:hypothetical protein
MAAPKRKRRARRYHRVHTADATRVKASPLLTRDEVKRLQARAAAEYRSISSYVTHLLLDHLRRGRRKRHRPTLANPLAHPSDRRSEYPVCVWLTREQQEELEARALNESRSVSNYVGTLLLKDLRRSR